MRDRQAGLGPATRSRPRESAGNLVEAAPSNSRRTIGHPGGVRGGVLLGAMRTRQVRLLVNNVNPHMVLDRHRVRDALTAGSEGEAAGRSPDAAESLGVGAAVRLGETA